MIKRRSTKQPDMRPIKGPSSSGLRGGGYDGPRVIGDRDDIKQVAAYDPGHKGKQQKARGPWFQR
jgi:hypothetical protein